MGDVTIFFNGECSKCRGAMALLKERGVDPDIVEYLVDPPTADQLHELSTKLGLPVRDIIRTQEPLYAQLGLQDASDEDLLEAIARHPVLLQRPIVVSGGRAVIGRPPERVLDLLPDGNG